MPIALARIETQRPSRYLGQFCKHAAAMGGRRSARFSSRDPLTVRWQRDEENAD